MQIGEVASFQNGYAFKSKDFVQDGKYKIIKIKELKGGKVRFFNDSASVDVNDEQIIKKYIVEKGNILFALTGDPVNKNNPLSWVGRVSVYEDDQLALLNQRVCKLIPKEGLNAKYIYYYFRTFNNFYALASIAKGSASQANISTKDIEAMEIALPPLNIQNRIVSVLDSMEEKINKNNKINENLLQQAQTLFYAWFVEYQPFGGIQPSDWKSISVYDLAEYINGAAFKKHEYADTGLPIIKIAELKNGITESTQHCCVEKDPTYYIKDRDILFSWSGNPETSIDTFVWSMGDAILNQHTFRVVSKYEAPAFTFFLLKYLKPQFTHIASNKQTTGLGHVTVKDLQRLQFCTNRQAIKDFNDLTMPIFEMIYSNCKEIQGFSTLRDALLPKLMSGEIDISSLDI